MTAPERPERVTALHVFGAFLIAVVFWIGMVVLLLSAVPNV